MSDIFREVEEDVRRERLQKLWKQYGDYVIAAAAVLIIGVAGFKLWQHYEYVQTQKASAAFIAAIESANGGKGADAAAAFAKLAKTAPGGYAAVSELAEANALLASGKKDEAVALYKKLADKRSDEIGQTARIRAAWALADSAPKNDLVDLLAPISKDNSGWRFMAREILAYADFREGHLPAALSGFSALAKDSEAPQAIRERAQAMATLLRTGVGDYGTLPADPQADKAAAPDDAANAGKDKAAK